MHASTGFDLDMTLIDSRPGIGAVYTALAEEMGTFIDVGLVTSRLGPPLEWELAHWFADDLVPAMADRYRALYPEIAVAAVAALPGAHEALEAARERGPVAIITAKFAANARLHVEHLGFGVDEIVGDAWREQKASALTRLGADLYVGDHVHDMDAARGAGITGVGVATGPSTADELLDAGAAAVLTSLEEFRDWRDRHHS